MRLKNLRGTGLRVWLLCLVAALAGGCSDSAQTPKGGAGGSARTLNLAEAE